MSLDAIFPPDIAILVRNWGKHNTRSVHVTMDGDSVMSILSVETNPNIWTEANLCVLKGTLSAREARNLDQVIELANKVAEIIHHPETTEDDIKGLE